jgi:methylthioribose-1-phosphate isomerase
MVCANILRTGGIMQKKVEPIEWLGDRVRILDQTKLPQKEVYLELIRHQQMAKAIKELKVRGAPTIGVAAAYGLVLGALQIKTENSTEFFKEFHSVVNTIVSTRPTARNLFKAVERMEFSIANEKDVHKIKEILIAGAINMHREEIAATHKLSEIGAALLKDGDTILTHCNAGSLATTGYGTALGVIIRAHDQGKKIEVYATETRPLCQGARLTTWELQKAGVPVTLITDSMAGYFMNRGEIHCVITGADRIVANGDAANKIGTYTLAVLAKENRIPFYIAAPTSTIDISLKMGSDIPIEERNGEEVTKIRGVQIAPDNIPVANPAFDVTPNEYITAIITEKGIIRRPYKKSLRELLKD